VLVKQIDILITNAFQQLSTAKNRIICMIVAIFVKIYKLNFGAKCTKIALKC